MWDVNKSSSAGEQAVPLSYCKPKVAGSIPATGTSSTLANIRNCSPSSPKNTEYPRSLAIAWLPMFAVVCLQSAKLGVSKGVSTFEFGGICEIDQHSLQQCQAQSQAL